VPVTKVVFSHTRADKPLVKAVHGALVAQHPELASSVEVQQLSGGEDLLESITAAVGEADRFFVFLSRNSIESPWVEGELKAAVLQGVGAADKDGFVVPVIIETMSAVPEFLAGKAYVDLRAKTKEEVVEAMYAAMTGAPPVPEPEAAPLNYEIRKARKPHTVEVSFWVELFALPASVYVQTALPIRAQSFRFEPMDAAPPMLGMVEKAEPFLYAIELQDVRLERGGPRLVLQLTFDPGANLTSALTGVGRYVFV
jgi:hypothetical protein